MSEEQEAVVRLYDAATGVGSWQQALECVARLVGTDTVVLFSQVPGTQTSTFLGGIGVTREAMHAYREYYGAHNVLIKEAAATMTPGIIRTSETICRAETLLRSEYYCDFMRPNSLRYALGMTLERSGGSAVHMTAFRPPDRRPFGERQQRTFSSIYPHARQAVRVAAELESARSLTQGLQSVTEQFDKGLALLDEHGAVLLANGAFEAMCAAQDGLSTMQGRVSVEGPSAKSFKAALACAAKGNPGGMVQVIRRSGTSAYSVLVSPMLRQMTGIGATTPHVALVVTDPAQVPAIDTSALRSRFGLTGAEARLVAALGRGDTLSTVCVGSGISIFTGRTHLKRAMAKIGVSRQADLMRVLLMFARSPQWRA